MAIKRTGLTVAVLTYNSEEIIRKCLDCILAQTYPVDEILVVDNCSTDNTAKIVKEYRKVNLYQTQNNLGFIGGINKCFDASKNYAVMQLSHDVFLEKDCIEKMVEYLQKNPTINIVQPAIYSTNGEVDNFGIKYIWPGYGLANKKPDGHFDFCSMVTFMADRRQIAILGGFDEKYNPAYYEDVDFYLRSKGRIRYGVAMEAKAVHIGSFAFSKKYTKIIITDFCRINRRKIIQNHFKGLDRLTRLAVSSGLDIVNQAFRVVRNWRVSKNDSK